MPGGGSLAHASTLGRVISFAGRFRERSAAFAVQRTLKRVAVALKRGPIWHAAQIIVAQGHRKGHLTAFEQSCVENVSLLLHVFSSTSQSSPQLFFSNFPVPR
jgi:hypothetical protein